MGRSFTNVPNILYTSTHEITALFYMLLFNFILGINFVFICFGVWYDNDLITSLNQKKMKFKPRIKLNHKIYEKPKKRYPFRAEPRRVPREYEPVLFSLSATRSEDSIRF